VCVRQAIGVLRDVDRHGEVANLRGGERLARHPRRDPEHQEAPDLCREGSSEHGEPGSWRLHGDLSLVEADPYRRGQLWYGADEPRVVVVVIGSGLPDLWPPDVRGGPGA